jgi:hypothetical protein
VVEGNQDLLSSFLQWLGFVSKQETPGTLPYQIKDDFLTAAEGAFYRVLKIAAGEELMVCPKVRLADIFASNHAEYYHWFNKIAKKHVDFLLCNTTTLRPVLGVELDDASHLRSDRMERDRFVEQVFRGTGLPLLRIPVRRTYDSGQLAAQIRQAILTPVPSAPTLLRTLLEPLRGVTRQETRPPAVETVKVTPWCPRCEIPMVLRTAQRGENKGQQFYGCTNYPRCRQIIPLD